MLTTMEHSTAVTRADALNYTTADLSATNNQTMSLSAKIAIGIVCGIMFLFVLVGNTFVVVAVAKFRRLRTPANALLLNLAIADVAVSIFVMTFSTMRLLNDGHWLLGSSMCKFWMSMDVLCCTASILNLCMISLDKYWAITRPLSYRREMSWRRTGTMMTFVWCCSGVISFVPIYTGLYAKDRSGESADDICGVNFSVNKYYAILSSLISFYVPLAVMLFTYCRIFVIARAQAIRIDKEMNRSEYLERSSPQCSVRSSSPLHSAADENGYATAPPQGTRRRSRSIVREYKAVRTLGLVMGCFILSWLPFFLMYVIMNFCDECYLSIHAENAITWLGYANSLMNPFIYNFRNQDFRYAFHVIAYVVLNALTCGYVDRKQGACMGLGRHQRHHRPSASSKDQANGNHMLCANRMRMEVLRRPPSEGLVLCDGIVEETPNDLACDIDMVADNESSTGSVTLPPLGMAPLSENNNDSQNQ